MRAVNLLTQLEPRRSRSLAWRRVDPVLVGVAGSAAVVLIGLFALSSSQGSAVAERRAELSSLQERKAEIDARIARQLTQTASAREQREAAVTSAVSTRVAWDRLLGRVALVMPANVWLTGLTTAAPGSGTPGASGSTASPPPSTSGTPSGAPAGQPVTFTGYAFTHGAVARVLSRLSLVPDLADVALESSTKASVGKRKLVQFTITATIQGTGGGA